VSRDPKHDILFEPVQIGPKTLRNRFYQVPHCTGFGVFKPHSQAAHRGMKAEGGWAGICTEFAPVSFDSDEAPYVPAQLVDERDLACLALMAEAVHEHGSLAGIELTHAGGQASTAGSRWTPVGPSQIASDYNPWVVAKAMELSDIRRVQADWVRAAGQAVEAGFDIVYVYGGTGYLPTQFLSPEYNKRTDAYGGSLENRARFWLETLEQVREAVGDLAAVAVRIGVGLVPGLETDEALEFVRLADPLVDLWDVNLGTIVNWAVDSGPSRFFPEGHELEWTGRVREATAKPIVGVSRLTSPDRMAEIVRSGVWDLIGAARPSIADPFLPRKIEEGRYDEVRECIGCNICIVKGDEWHHLGCTQNATAGEEYRRGWHPERFEPAANADRDVLVVGAGPAGMECAIVLGKRGLRRVHLVEAEAEIGGLLRWVPRLPGLGEWARLSNWRQIQLGKLRAVEIIAGERLSAAEVREYGAEIVVVATGSRWAGNGLGYVTREPIPGADAALPHVLTPEQVMVDGKRPPGRRAVVYDTEGYFMGASLAEQLALDGYAVELVTSLLIVAPLCEHTLERDLLCERLAELGVEQRVATTVTAVAPGGVSCADAFGRPFDLETDGVVLVTQRVSDEALYLELASDRAALEAAGIEALYRIGDCAAPRLIADAIFDGHRLAREIDSPDPSVPLPHLQERVAAAGSGALAS
jgi:dimethylamine/trimethylamine dehydrogenase